MEAIYQKCEQVKENFVATIAAYLQRTFCDPVHVVTVNEYLKRDSSEMRSSMEHSDHNRCSPQ